MDAGRNQWRMEVHQELIFTCAAHVECANQRTDIVGSHLASVGRLCKPALNLTYGPHDMHVNVKYVKWNVTHVMYSASHRA